MNDKQKNIDEDELVAVLTAAVAILLNTAANRLHIHSFKKVNEHSHKWRKAARKEQMESRRFNF